MAAARLRPLLLVLALACATGWLEAWPCEDGDTLRARSIGPTSRLQYWQLFPQPGVSGGTWANVQGAALPLVNDGRATLYGFGAPKAAASASCPRFLAVDTACGATAADVKLVEATDQKWVLEGTSQPGHVYIRNAAVAAACPRKYLGFSRTDCSQKAPRLWAKNDPAAYTLWELYQVSPGRPTIASIKIQGANVLSLNVPFPSGVGPFWFQVEGLPDAAGAPVLNQTSFGFVDTNFPFKTHAPGVWYTFTARANNGLMWSQKSLPLRFKTPTKPDPPSIARVYVDGHQKLVANLVPGFNGGSSINEYSCVGTPTNGGTQMKVSGPGTKVADRVQLTFEAAPQGGKSFTFRAWARNNVAWSTGSLPALPVTLPPKCARTQKCGTAAEAACVCEAPWQCGAPDSGNKCDCPNNIDYCIAYNADCTCAECVPGSTPSTDKKLCEPCGVFRCSSYSDACACDECVPGWKAANGACVACPAIPNCVGFVRPGECLCGGCLPGYALQGNACTACPASCKTCDPATLACTECNAGFRLSGSACEACDTANCASCPATKAQCESCLPGWSLDAGGVCQQCPPNCDQCPPGNQSGCDKCASGFRWTGTACKACASAHCDSCPEETDEVVNCGGCKPGYQLEIDETCTPCVQPAPASSVAGTCLLYGPAGAMECACQQCNTWMPQWCDVPEQTFFAR